MPTPPIKGNQVLSDDEAHEYVFALQRVFKSNVLTLTQFKAIIFLYAIEQLGTKSAASEALEINVSTGWRWLRQTGLTNFVDPVGGSKE